MRNLLARVQANIGRQLLLNDLVAMIETDFEEYGRVVDEPRRGTTSVSPRPTPTTIPWGRRMPIGSVSAMAMARWSPAVPSGSGAKAAWWT